MFLSLTMPNGLPLDIPAASVLFLEALDAEARQANPGCRSGLFFDLGNGSQAILVQEPFGKLAKRIDAARPGDFIQVRGHNGGGVKLLWSNVVSLRGLPDEHPNDGKCQIAHRLPPAPLPDGVPPMPRPHRILLLDVLETRDDVRARIPIEVEPDEAEEEEIPDGGDSSDQ